MFECGGQGIEKRVQRDSFVKRELSVASVFLYVSEGGAPGCVAADMV